jgi:hypothetical protein
MAQPPADIEQAMIDEIVRRVLAELAVAPDATSAADKPAVPPPGDLAIDSRVLTLSELEGRLEGVRRLVVPPAAVVTPAVRDELRRRNVALAYGSSPGRGAALLRMIVVTHAGRFDAAPLLASLAGEAVQIDQHSSDCVIAAVDRLAGELARPGTLGLLLTRHTAAGLCLANRLRGVRAVSGTEAGEVSAAAAAVGANLLVIDPIALSPFQLKRITTEFCRAGARPCPRVFMERLA